MSQSFLLPMTTTDIVSGYVTAYVSSSHWYVSSILGVCHGVGSRLAASGAGGRGQEVEKEG